MLQTAKRFWGNRPGFDVGDILHVSVNIGFALVVYLMVFHWQLTLLAFLLVIISKWRILAVKPRFWMPNIRANLVDIIVGLSIVGLLHHTRYTWLAIIWMGLYGVWLLALKPRDHEVFVGIQALWAQLFGLVAVLMTAQLVRTPVAACILVWLVAWSAARHFFSNYEEPHYRLLTLTWSFFAVQLTWVGLHWIQYYRVFNMGFSVTALIISVVALSMGSMYHALKKGTFNKSVMMENMLFGGVLLGIILVTAGWTSSL